MARGAPPVCRVGRGPSCRRAHSGPEGGPWTSGTTWARIPVLPLTGWGTSTSYSIPPGLSLHVYKMGTMVVPTS